MRICQPPENEEHGRSNSASENPRPLSTRDTSASIAAGSPRRHRHAGTRRSADSVPHASMRRTVRSTGGAAPLQLRAGTIRLRAPESLARD